MTAFLKAITLQGFKSFADRVRIDLEHGMSVVVGPNGCGKSNIADAIRWVLGEQSARNLRGGRMEDVIFAGSRTRRPVGMAEVSLHFDNSGEYFSLPYAEVTVTRRMFRDGGGECFINRTSCRLRDIQELFLDTGAGREGFSVIGQGQVEQILNLRAEERRFLIEEAAGISKFRLRKKEALKKLEDTELNLSRVSDIINEVAARLEPLARQAEEAAAFQAWERELRELEKGLLVRAEREAAVKLAEAAARQAERETCRAEAAAAVASGEKDCLAARLALDEAEANLRRQREEIHAAETESQTREHALALSAEHGRHLRSERERLCGEISAKRERCAVRRSKLAAGRIRAEELRADLAAGRAKLSIWETDRSALRGTGSERAEALKNEIFGVLSRQSAAQNDCVSAEHSLAVLEKEKKLRREEQERCGAELKRCETERRALEAAAEQAAADQAELGARSDELARLALEIEAAAKHLAGAERESEHCLEQARARGQALRQLDENREGYRRGVRALARAIRRSELTDDGFWGTVADNLSVNSEYENAVSAALGASLQDIIVATAARGQEYIAWLRAGRYGRVTFLPLDTLRHGPAPDLTQFQNIDGFVGAAADLTSYSAAVAGAIRFLLGRIMVAADMDAALAVARRANFRLRVVTLEGDQVNVGGSLTGGGEEKDGESQSLLRRRREITELDAAAETLLAELTEFTARREALAAESGALAAERNAVAARKQETEKKKELLAIEQKHNGERRAQLSERLKLLELECLAGRERRAETEAALTGRREAKAALASELAALQAEQAEAAETARAAVEQLETLNARITAGKVEEARRKEELRQLEFGAAEAEEKNRRDERETQAAWRRAEALTQEEAELLTAAESDAARLAVIRKNLEKWRLTLVSGNAERERLNAALTRSEEQVRQARAVLRRAEQEAHQEALALERGRAEAEMLREKLQNDFGLDQEAAALIDPVSPDVEQGRRRAETLKEKIAELGPVNLGALTEYPVARDRHDFLRTQYADLVAAGGALRELIARLDADMKERFADGFQAVNASFAKVFQELFEGGEAKLVLEDPARLLETGVGIVAQPPGKKARLLSLLSGGERAFTAIALLLALLRVKPAPFCLLDEIESALDETNVRRFANYIRKLSAETQFILISHRRGAMEAADRLYGLTMEESGVSKLLTLNIRASNKAVS